MVERCIALNNNYRMYQSGITLAQLGAVELTGMMPCQPGSCISNVTFNGNHLMGDFEGSKPVFEVCFFLCCEFPLAQRSVAA